MEDQREKHNRHVVFAYGIAAVLLLIGLNCYTDWMDGPLLSYRIISLLCAAVVGLSLYYWWVVKRSHAVFRFLILLAAGLGYDTQVQAHSRILRLSGDVEAFNSFGASWLWSFRQGGEIIALIYLLAVIVTRMSGVNDQEKP